MSFAAAPVATAAILVPSINNSQNCAIVTDVGMMDSPCETTQMLQEFGSNENKRKVSMQEKICSTPSSSMTPKVKILEKKQSESFISTPDTFSGALRSKFQRRKSQTDNQSKDSLKL